MKYFYVKPAVSGGLDQGTIMDSGAHPPVVSRLVYQIEGWSGDALITSFPCFLVTEEAARALLALNFTGATFASVEITISDNFRELYPDVELPSFVWLRVNGQAGHDDFGLARICRLVVSERVLDVLDELGIPGADFDLFDELQQQ